MKSQPSHKQTLEQMEQRLRQERPSCDPGAGFTERVMASLPPFVEKPRPASPLRWLRLLPVVSAGSAALAIGVAVSVFGPARPHRPAPPPQLAQAAHPEPAEPFTAARLGLALQLPKLGAEQWQTLSVRLDAPLEEELERVINDTRQAIQFVASSFLTER